jgi:hypothetical protein
MATVTYIYKPRHDRHLSVAKLSVILTNLALWAGMITAVALIVR